MSVAKTIVAVMRDIEAIGKGRRNQAQGFNFRGIDDVYNELHQIMAKHGLFTVPRVIAERCEDRQTKSGGNAIYRVLSIEFDFVNETGDKITVGPMIGEGMDSGDKASNKAHSIAHKYALLQVFIIPTVEKKDPDEDSYQTSPRATQPAAMLLDSVEEKTSKAGKNFFVVRFSNGAEAITFSETLAAECTTRIGLAVTPTVETKESNGKEFYNLTGIA